MFEVIISVVGYLLSQEVGGYFSGVFLHQLDWFHKLLVLKRFMLAVF